MTGPVESIGGFRVRTIGPEPSGATPIADEDLEGLIPDFVATRADLNQVEFENIAKALPWALRRARFLGPDGVLDHAFMTTLHVRMFGDVWRWAGKPRRRLTNIGVDPHEITTRCRLLFDDAKLWHAESVFSHDERAARIHGRLVAVHPFPNGNGRCTRMLADLYLTSIGAAPFVWGGTAIDTDGTMRATYIAALVKAVETDDYDDLVSFARAVKRPEDISSPAAPTLLARPEAVPPEQRRRPGRELGR
ncbi:MAG TPA: mobile mystery protein B [Acidimicrobiales bacterium]|nr:mobile mystery protein B [Acidimicrobiales bacterium]